MIFVQAKRAPFKRRDGDSFSDPMREIGTKEPTALLNWTRESASLRNDWFLVEPPEKDRKRLEDAAKQAAKESKDRYAAQEKERTAQQTPAPAPEQKSAVETMAARRDRRSEDDEEDRPNKLPRGT